jgi:hypothetical protein
MFVIRITSDLFYGDILFLGDIDMFHYEINSKRDRDIVIYYMYFFTFRWILKLVQDHYLSYLYIIFINAEIYHYFWHHYFAQLKKNKKSRTIVEIDSVECTYAYFNNIVHGESEKWESEWLWFWWWCLNFVRASFSILHRKWNCERFIQLNYLTRVM